MKFNQDLCLRTCDMNSTPGSVVPLTMFKMYSMIMPYRQFAINPFSFWKHLPRLILASFSPALSLWWWPAPLQILIVAASQPHLVLARQDRICGNRGPAGGPPTPQRGLQLLPHCWGQGGGGGEDFEKILELELWPVIQCDWSIHWNKGHWKLHFEIVFKFMWPKGLECV